jgi:hypothetical protein
VVKHKILFFEVDDLCVDDLRAVFSNRFTVFLVTVIFVLLWLRPGGSIWLMNDFSVSSYLRENVETSYGFIELGSVTVSRQAYSTGYDFGPGLPGIWYRYFMIFQYDPETTLSSDNFRIDGWVDQIGRVSIFGHMPASSGYQ